ncbi:BQ2448_594 [Microbotryum intermedium]|uniref:BQ2448_594 protein n=1 Tax=Microbotryum intermedium TaxID=269621 RepID=A0A238F8X4_9BASI|nr:BQ2448_594 [Microbotryum intermedium]
MTVMAPARPTLDRRNSAASTSSTTGSSGGGATGGLRKAFGAVARRVSLNRRDPSDNKAHRVNKLPSIQYATNTSSNPRTSVSSRSDASSLNQSFVSSLAAPRSLLNSPSPASELPQTWFEWNKAYQIGLIDYNDPPPPPTSLWIGSENASPTGQYRAPLPVDEGARQRAVDNLDLLNHKPYERRGSVRVSPNTSRKETESDAEADSRRSVDPNAEDDLDSQPLDRTTPIVHEVHGDVGLLPPYPEDLATHPALLKLAQTAKKRFNTNGGTVSLLDQGSQVFLAEEGFHTRELPRQSTICSHTMLKAAATKSKEPLVVLDIANDWRFASNDFGQFTKGLYAAAPIMLPSAPGDSEEMQPCGIFCVIDSKPRGAFSEEDCQELERMAAAAAEEILKAAQDKSTARATTLKTKREAWRRSKLVRRVSEKTSLAAVEELSTPPTSPDMLQSRDGGHSLTATSLAAVERSDSSTSDILECSSDGTPSALASKRGSLADTTSDGGSVDLAFTDMTPTFGRRRGRLGVHAAASRVPPEIKSVLDLSTQLVAESLEIDFTYIAAIDLPKSSAPRVVGEKPMRLLSSHNLPIPAPLFNVDLHLEALTSHQQALLYTDPEFSGAEGEFSSGLLIKILTTDDVGYVLGAFTENPRRILNKQDFHFMKFFANDLDRQVAKL